jgi:sulfur transfer protein SufE
MSTSANEEKVLACPEALQAIIEEFQEVEPRDRLEYLIEYAMDLPDLPERLMASVTGMEQVHECMSPVYLFTEIEDGIVHFYFDIPTEAPTVRGYAGILVEGSGRRDARSGAGDARRCLHVARSARSDHAAAAARLACAGRVYEATGQGSEG